MKNIILFLIVITLITACSSDENQPVTETEESNITFLFGIRNVDGENYDLSGMAYVINGDYENPIAACRDASVKEGDEIILVGSTNIVGPDIKVRARITSDGIHYTNIILTKGNSNLEQGLQYKTCYIPDSTTVLGNPPYWISESGNNTIIIAQ